MNELLAVSEADYHQDQTSLSSTGARKVLRSPAKFRWEQTHPPEPKQAFDFGKLAHRLVLGEGAEIAAIDAADYRTKDAQKQRDEARANGLTPILAGELDAAVAIEEAVREHPTAGELFAAGVPERSGYWQDEPTDVRLRFRPDWLTELDGQPVCVDLKTTVSADPDEFVRSVTKFQYHMQAAFYLDGLSANGIDGARFLFVAVEKTAPYLVSVIELDNEALVEGRRLNRQAIDLYDQCVRTDTWPGYGDNIHTISLPRWAMRDGIQADAGSTNNDLIAALEAALIEENA